MSLLTSRRPAVKLTSPLLRWREAVQTLARLHRVKPASVGLLDFGKRSGFYSRQLKTLGGISAAQARVQDIETKKMVGDIPNHKAIVEFLSDVRTQPRDRASLIHGDYKIDNLVFHRSEPRVIGILEYAVLPATWRMASTDGFVQLGDVNHRSSIV